MILLIFGICILLFVGSLVAENNKIIKDLRDKQIKGDVYRWWLYFGGNKNG